MARCADDGGGAQRGIRAVSRRWGRALAGLVQGFSAAQKPWRRAAIRLRTAQFLQQRIAVPTRYGDLVFVIDDPGELLHAREFHIREPETLAWIDGFETPCRFWDVGANIGSFSLYGGRKPGVEVIAFEPAAANYLALCRNIDANGLSARVRALCLALSDRTELGDMNLSQFSAGGVFNIFNSTEDCFGRQLDVVARHGMVGFSIDEFRRVFGVPAPHYLKIDVDSVEEAILAGSADTLRHRGLRSVLIEIEEAETARNARLRQVLESCGFHLALRSPGGRGGAVNAIFTRVPVETGFVKPREAATASPAAPAGSA